LSVTSLARIDHERRSRIHLVVAPTKQMERFEWMLEKCTEIGVDRITPLVTARTERGKLRRDRLERVLVGAMKQSQRAWLPQLDEMTPINDLIDRGIPAQRCFGWCEGEHRPFSKTYDPEREAIMLIGPEGDFTLEEAGLLRHHGFAAVGLGAARLRTETAAVTACSWMNLAQLV
jgi:16S rRNA (uracil1498-N3)-methyltransferase